MNNEPSKEMTDDRALEQTAAALREAAGADAEALPPEVRRATLQALWVADAARYEHKARRNARLLRLATVAVAAAVLVGFCGLLAHLAQHEWQQRRLIDAQRQATALQRPAPPATAPTTAAAPPTSAPATAEAPPAYRAAGGAVSGRVVFLGAPPPQQPIRTGMPECHVNHPPLLDESIVVGQGGGLANVVVSIDLPDGAVPSGDVQPEPAVLDQRGCRYVPHVLAVSVGQRIIVKNSDPFLHNVHSVSIDNPGFNFGQPNVDPGRDLGRMRAPEHFRVKCDVHPWMAAWVCVFEHRYFAVTGEDGAFVIPGTLPDGQYTLTAWHEKLGEKRAHVIIQGGKASTADFVFDAAGL